MCIPQKGTFLYTAQKFDLCLLFSYTVHTGLELPAQLSPYVFYISYLCLLFAYTVHTGLELPAQVSQKIDIYVPFLAVFVHGHQKKILLFGL